MQTIHQWPSTKVQLMGSPFSLVCIVKGTSNPNLYWYRKAEEGGLQMLFYSTVIDQIDSQVPQNLEASRPQDGHFILRSKKLLLSDSGFYFCAWSITLSWGWGGDHCAKTTPSLESSPHFPGTLTGGLGGGYLSTGFLTVSQSESNRIKAGSPKEYY